MSGLTDWWCSKNKGSSNDDNHGEKLPNLIIGWSKLVGDGYFNGSFEQINYFFNHKMKDNLLLLLSI